MENDHRSEERPALTSRGKAELWCALALPSMYSVQRYLGFEGLVLYALVAALGVFVVPRMVGRLSARHLAALGGATIGLVVLVFFLVYPDANTTNPLLGSDDDDAYNLGVRALFALQSPYTQVTYLDNVLHQLPGAFILAAPFVLLGTSALQNLFWLPIFFLVLKQQSGDSRTALGMSWLVLALSPAVMLQVISGTGHAANTIYVLLGLWWLTRTKHRDSAALAWGVALASRANFFLLLPLAFAWFYQRYSWSVALRVCLLACSVSAILTVPFYLHDPENFGPADAANYLLRFDGLFPYAGLSVMALMAAVSVGLSFRPMDTAALFRNCALVQAVPVVAATILSRIMNGQWETWSLSYATFFAWFVFMALAATEPKSTSTRLV